MKSSERCFRSEYRQPAMLGRVALAFLATSILLLSKSAIAKEMKSPVFLEPISNETVPSGRDVRLACVVDHLGSFKLAWIQQDRSAILTVGKHVITRNPRIGVMHDEHRTWYLLIRSVKPGDAGTYMCQINTEPVTSQIGVVNVVVPPYIKDEMTSNDVRLQEGSTVSLACSSRGSPIPTVKWKREDGRPIRINSTRNVEEVSGPILRLTHLIRSDMGAYLCIASNGVPPSVSKRIQVQVKFRPSVYAPHQLFGVILGQDAKLECLVEAWPPGLNYWKRPKGFEILHTDEKYNVSTEEGSQDYKTRMVLVVKNFTTDDIGDYNCISNNSQGGAEQVIRVSASTTIITNSNLIDKSHNNAKEPPQSSGKPALKPVNWSKESAFDERDHFLNRKKDKIPNSIIEETKENTRAKNFFPLNTLEEDVDASSAATATSTSFSFIQNSFGFVIGMFAILSSQVEDWEEMIPNIRSQVKSKVVLNRRNELYPEFSNSFSEDYFLTNWRRIENVNKSCTENEYFKTRTECELNWSRYLETDVRKNHPTLSPSNTKNHDPFTLKHWRTLCNYVPTFLRNTSITENILNAGCTLVWWFALHFLIDLATWKG